LRTNIRYEATLRLLLKKLCYLRPGLVSCVTEVSSYLGVHFMHVLIFQWLCACHDVSA